MYDIQYCFIYRPSDSIVSEDAGIEPRTVTSLRLRHWLSDAPTTQLDLIHIRLDLIHTRLDLIHTRLDLIHNRLDLIHTRLDLIHTRLDLIHTQQDLTVIIFGTGEKCTAAKSDTIMAQKCWA
jgi:hypothetical protein